MNKQINMIIIMIIIMLRMICKFSKAVSGFSNRNDITIDVLFTHYFIDRCPPMTTLAETTELLFFWMEK